MNESNALEKVPKDKLDKPADGDYTEKALEQDLYQKGRESMLAELNLPESAEQKMERLEMAVNELASLASQISPELYAKDKNKFDQLNDVVQQKLREIEVLMVTFETTINLEYPKVPAMQKLAILLISLVRSNVKESTLIQTFGGNKAKKETLLNALNAFKKLHEQYRDQIEDSKIAHLKTSQKEILKDDNEYKKLTDDLISINRDIEIVKNFSLLNISYSSENAAITLVRIWQRWVGTDYPGQAYELREQLLNILGSKESEIKEKIKIIKSNAMTLAEKKENGN